MSDAISACPHCNAAHYAEVLYCPFCGYAVGAIADPPGAAEGDMAPSIAETPAQDNAPSTPVIEAATESSPPPIPAPQVASAALPKLRPFSNSAAGNAAVGLCAAVIVAALISGWQLLFSPARELREQRFEATEEWQKLRLSAPATIGRARIWTSAPLLLRIADRVFALDSSAAGADLGAFAKGEIEIRAAQNRAEVKIGW